MNDAELHDLLRTHARVNDTTVASWNLQSTDLALLDEIAATRKTRAPWRRQLIAVAASVIAVTGVITGVTLAGPGHNNSAYAADVLAGAREDPRLLIDDPDWKMVSVNEYSNVNGEMLFSDGQHQVHVNWYKADQLKDYITDRENSGAKPVPARLLGRPATTMLYDGKPDEILGLINDDLMVDVGIGKGNESVYPVVSAKLRTVSVDKWLDALPASVFSGNRRNLAIDELLTGIPIPPGWDAGPLKQRGFVSDRYQLGAAVAADIGCAWFDRWFDARENHDQGAAAAAGRALRGSRNWPVLKEMVASGAYSQVFWTFAGYTKTGKNMDANPPQPLRRNEINNAIGCS